MLWSVIELRAVSSGEVRPRGSPHLLDHLPQGLEPGACLPRLFLDTTLTIAIALATLYLVGRKSPIICW